MIYMYDVTFPCPELHRTSTEWSKEGISLPIGKKKHRRQVSLTYLSITIVYRDMLHRLQSSPGTFLNLPFHANTNATSRAAPAKLDKMPEGALNSSGAELCGAPREFDDRAESSATCVCRCVDERAAERAKQLRVREDEALTLRMAAGQVGQRVRGLEHNIRFARFEVAR
jgi:hypothetical protein